MLPMVPVAVGEDDLQWLVGLGGVGEHGRDVCRVEVGHKQGMLDCKHVQARPGRQFEGWSGRPRCARDYPGKPASVPVRGPSCAGSVGA